MIGVGVGARLGRKEILGFVETLRREKVIDEVESYNFDDARALKGKFRPNGVNPDFVFSVDVPYRERLYSFTGTSEESQESRLRGFSIIDETVRKIYPKTSKWCVAENHDPRDGWLPYCEFVKKSASAEICVDLFRLDPEEGFSFRIPEALWLNRKIISNRLCLKEEVFYSPERIFLIGVDPIERLRSFLEADIEPLSIEILNFYDTRLWWTENDPVWESRE